MLPTLPFGRTGHESTRLIFGAAALGGMRQEKADATIEMVRSADALIGWTTNSDRVLDALDRL